MFRRRPDLVTPYMTCLLGLFLVNVCHGMDASTEDWILQRLEELTQKEMVQDSLIRSLQRHNQQQDAIIKTLQRDPQQPLPSNQIQADEDLLRELEESPTHQQADLKLPVAKLQQLTESQQKHADLQQQILDLEDRVDNPYFDPAPGHSQLEQEMNVVHMDSGEDTAKSEAETGEMQATEPALSNVVMTAVNGREARGRRLLIEGTTDEPETAEPVVAFHVLSNESHTVVVNDNMVLPTLLVNLGDAYGVQHGLFTAPTHGLYLFSLTVASHKTDGTDSVTAVILKNGFNIGTAIARGDDGHVDQGSVTVVTRLHAGDEVWTRLRCCNGNQYYGAKLSSFTGVRLQNM